MEQSLIYPFTNWMHSLTHGSLLSFSSTICIVHHVMWKEIKFWERLERNRITQEMTFRVFSGFFKFF